MLLLARLGLDTDQPGPRRGERVEVLKGPRGTLFGRNATGGARCGTLAPRVEYRYQTGMFFSIFEDPFVSQGPYDVWNVRVAYESPKGRWYLAGFARNLGDTLYARNVIRSDGIFGKLSFWGASRTYGLQLGMRY